MLGQSGHPSKFQSELQLQSQELLSLCEAMVQAKDTVQIERLITAAVGSIGAPHWNFAVITRDFVADELVSYRFMVSDNIALFIQLYEAKRWYVIDPALRHAQRSGDWARWSALFPENASRGQLDLLAKARECGISDGFVVPAHTASTTRVGALQLLWGNSELMDPARMQALAVPMRTFAVITLDRLLAQACATFRRRAGITDRDVTVLSYAAEGLRSKEIAERQRVSARTIDQRFGRMMTKTGCAGRGQVVDAAKEIGII